MSLQRSGATSPSPAIIREHNLALVLAALREGGPGARADIAARTGLSKPTVAVTLRAFEAAGLVREYGRTRGRRGPPASVYEPVADAVLALGLDIGPRSVRWIVADLDGGAVADGVAGVEQPRRDDVVRALAGVKARMAPYAPRIEAAVAGSPGIIDPATSRIGAAPTIDGWEGIVAEAAVSRAIALPVEVENDVNLAALGERARGGGRAVDSFAYLNVGTGLGAGIILHGALHRGARGAAGEVGFLPVGADPFAAARGGHEGAMEARLSAHGLLAAAERLAAGRRTRVERPFDIRALFAAAATGDELGRALVAHASREIAVCIAGLTSVVDLELVLLGGGIGASDELVVEDVRRSLAGLVPTPPQVARARLGEGAVLAGAVSVALAAAESWTIRRVAASEDAAAAASSG